MPSCEKTETVANPGEGAITFELSGGRTAVTRAVARSPLRLLTPRPPGPAAWAFTSSFGGGIVDGDVLRIDVSVGEGASALVTTQASTKVYRSPKGARQVLSATVAEGALLALLPDPVACFGGANFASSASGKVPFAFLRSSR